MISLALAITVTVPYISSVYEADIPEQWTSRYTEIMITESVQGDAPMTQHDTVALRMCERGRMRANEKGDFRKSENGLHREGFV